MKKHSQALLASDEVMKSRFKDIHGYLVIRVYLPNAWVPILPCDSDSMTINTFDYSPLLK